MRVFPLFVGSVLIAHAVGLFLVAPLLDYAVGFPVMVGVPVFAAFGVLLVVLGLRSED
ncbi:MAG: hypothetical protein LN415_03815 [Candidatus Thermoplasmatota archaeon]|nr:hypothetical protein [Candidatus Thermoplasmatota archaeon]